MKWLLYMALVSSGAAHGYKIYVDQNGGNPAGVDSASLREIIASSAQDLGHDIVPSPDRADYILTPKVLKFGENYVVIVEKREGSKVLRSSKLKARRAEELDEVATRVVRAVLTDVPAEKDARPSDVTEAEVDKGMRRKLVRSGKIFGVGPAFLGGLESRGVALFFGYGSGWAIGDVLVGMRGDIAIDFFDRDDPTRSTAFLGSINVNATYFFMDRDTSPFLTAEFGWGLARSSIRRDFGGGLHVGAVGGIALARTHELHFQIGAKGAMLLESSHLNTPTSLGFWLGVSF